jgi:putative ATP-dependent endonuclease of OLD family
MARDNTTIVRVERSSAGDIEGTTIFRPERAQLDDDDKKNIKLLNLCDPYLAEFFFGGRTIIVEGDTEYTAFHYLREMNPDIFKNVHIVRARGKATIVSLMKILNHFGAPYSVLHDSDTKTAMREGKEITNGAWTTNFKILDESKKATQTPTLVASVPNFEGAYFDEQLKSEKPYTALIKLREKDMFYDNVFKLFKFLIDQKVALPENALCWNKNEDLESLEL